MIRPTDMPLLRCSLPLLVLVPCEIGHHLCSGGAGSNKSRYDDCEYYLLQDRERRDPILGDKLSQPATIKSNRADQDAMKIACEWRTTPFQCLHQM